MEELHRVFHVEHFSEEQFAKKLLLNVKRVIKFVKSASIAGIHLYQTILFTYYGLHFFRNAIVVLLNNFTSEMVYLDTIPSERWLKLGKFRIILRNVKILRLWL